MSLDDVRAALAGASASDGDVRAVYLAVARSRLAAAQRDLVALDAVVTAKELEMVRLRHGDGQQLVFGGPKP